MTNQLPTIVQNLPGYPGKPTLNRWFDIWINTYKKGHVKPTTLDTYLAIYNKHIRNNIGDHCLCDFRQVHIRSYLNSILAQGYSFKYLGTIQTLLNMLFESAIDNELISTNPCSHIPRSKVDLCERRVLSISEQQKISHMLLRHRFNRIEPLITTLLGTGLRIGEALGLRWTDIHPSIEELSYIINQDYDSTPYLTVSNTLVRVNNEFGSGTHYILQPPKTRSSIRSIPLQRKVTAALLRQWSIKKNDMSDSNWSPLPGLDNLVFSGKKGQPQWRSTIESRIGTIIKTINEEEIKMAESEKRSPDLIEKVLPHTFRHTFATRSLEAGIPPKIVQHWLGHASIKMTLDLYTHVSEDLSTNQMDILENYMKDPDEYNNHSCID